MTNPKTKSKPATAEGNGSEAPLSEAVCSECVEIAKRVPFRMCSHLNGGTEHVLMYENAKLNVRVEIVTKYRRGQPAGSKRTYYVAENESPEYARLADLLAHYPLLRQLAESLYPPNA